MTASSWDCADLAALLRLNPIGENRFAIPHNEANLRGEVFGGQYLGQALAAALATGRGRAPHAMHAFFLGAARADRPMEARVECVRDGRSFSHRRVRVFQGDKEVFSAEVSLHDAESGEASHQATMPDVPPPDSLRNLEELFAQHGESAIGVGSGGFLVRKLTAEVRPTDPLAGFVQPGAEPQTSIWFHARNFVSAEPLEHYAAIAYLSDLWANAACRITHGRTLFSGDTATVSLNHCIWFHRPPSVADWLLYATDGPSTHGGTGFNRGQIFDRAGGLIASIAQEALVRRLR